MDTVKEKSEIWQRIKVSDGCINIEGFPVSEEKLYILCPYGIGDTLFAASLVSSYKLYFQENREVYFLVKKNQKSIPDWFSGIDGKIVSDSLVDTLNLYCIANQMWRLDNFIYGHFKKNMQGRLYHDFYSLHADDPVSLYKKLVFSIPPECSYDRPDIKDKLGKIPCNMDKRRIILMPYANTIAPVPADFWEILAEILHMRGYQLYTNVKDETEQAIRGTKTLSGDLDTVVSLCRASCAVISIRSGLCDVLAFTDVLLFVINTNEYYYQNWNVADLARRENIRNYLFKEEGSLLKILEEVVQSIPDGIYISSV